MASVKYHVHAITQHGHHAWQWLLTRSTIWGWLRSCIFNSCINGQYSSYFTSSKTVSIKVGLIFLSSILLGVKKRAYKTFEILKRLTLKELQNFVKFQSENCITSANKSTQFSCSQFQMIISKLWFASIVGCQL